MDIYNECVILSDSYIFRVIVVLFLCFTCRASDISLGMESKFEILGSEFYQRGKFDSGEIRIFLKNISKNPASIKKCALSNDAGKEIKYLYAKLAPPFLMPGQNGELLIKLHKPPVENSSVIKCTINGDTNRGPEILIPVIQTGVWISYIGFSEDLCQIYVYVENRSEKCLTVRLDGVGENDTNGDRKLISKKLLPKDKGCLVFRNSYPFTFGEYVYVTVSAESEGRVWYARRIVKAINSFPLIFADGRGDRSLGLDPGRFFVQSTSGISDIPCVQNMVCPAHKKDAPEKVAQKFLDNYHELFSGNPYLLTQMWICRFDKPRAWYKFALLPDIAVMNPIRPAKPEYEFDEKSHGRFNPFFWLGETAKKATEPNKYFACIPLYPEADIMKRNNYTPDEMNFLVYSAIASGAKGIIYRGSPYSERVRRRAFVSLNKQLQNLKSLLMIAESVNWASANDDDYIVKSMLCGDKAILLAVFDNRYFSWKNNKSKLSMPVFGNRIKSVKITVEIPDGFIVSNVESLYGLLSEKLWGYCENKLDFTVQLMNSVHIYKIILAGRTNSAR